MTREADRATGQEETKKVLDSGDWLSRWGNMWTNQNDHGVVNHCLHLDKTCRQDTHTHTPKQIKGMQLTVTEYEVE